MSMSVYAPLQWEDANCLGMTDGDPFYPVRGTSQRVAKAAKAVCNGEDGVHDVCPRRQECLEYALERKDRDGVWGGMSVRDRDKLRAKRRKAAQLELISAIDVLVTNQTPTDDPMENVVPINKPRKKPAATLERAAKVTASSQRKPTGELSRFAEARKAGPKLLPSIHRFMQMRPQDEDRHHDLIHVSEMAKNDWCPRATYTRIRAARAGRVLARPAPHFQLDNIFEEGDRIHEKWQSYLWEAGMLWGKYECYGCGHLWWDQSPQKCETCGARREVIAYRELPMDDLEHLIIGHADGEARGDEAMLVEIKSIGAGTVRVEAPKMTTEYTRKYVDADGNQRSYLDHEALFRDLHRPFPSHLRQGQIYLHLRNLAARRYGWPEVKRIVFIYEYKPTQAVKEFVIGMDDEFVEETLDLCKDITWALDNDRIPTCIKGRKERCAACKALEELDEEEQPAAPRGGDPASESSSGSALTGTATPPRRPTRVARRPDRPRRPGPDRPARSDHSLGGLLRNSTRDGLHR